MAKLKKRQQLSAITTKRLPSGYHISNRLWWRQRRARMLGGKTLRELEVKRLGDLIAERKRLRRIKELGRKLEKAIINAERRGYTGGMGSGRRWTDDPRVKVLRQAYLKAGGGDPK